MISLWLVVVADFEREKLDIDGPEMGLILSGKVLMVT
jgi:hypothetical protein